MKILSISFEFFPVEEDEKKTGKLQQMKMKNVREIFDLEASLLSLVRREGEGGRMER